MRLDQTINLNELSKELLHAIERNGIGAVRERLCRIRMRFHKEPRNAHCAGRARERRRAHLILNFSPAKETSYGFL